MRGRNPGGGEVQAGSSMERRVTRLAYIQGHHSASLLSFGRSPALERRRGERERGEGGNQNDKMHRGDLLTALYTRGLISTFGRPVLLIKLTPVAVSSGNGESKKGGGGREGAYGQSSMTLTQPRKSERLSHRLNTSLGE